MKRATASPNLLLLCSAEESHASLERHDIFRQIRSTILSLKSSLCRLISWIVWKKRRRWLKETLMVNTCLITIMAYRGGHNWNTAGALDFLTAVSINAVTKRSHRDTDRWTCVSSLSKEKAVTVTPSPVFVMIILQHQSAWLKLPGKLCKRRL